MVMSSLGFLYASYIPDWVEKSLKMPMNAELHPHLKPDLSFAKGIERNSPARTEMLRQ